MIENLPRSVVIAIKAAAHDVANTVKGGAYNPTGTEKLANTLEKFMIGMVAQSYPKVRSAWLDKDADSSWTKVAAGPTVDPVKLATALTKFYSAITDPNLKKNNIGSATSMLLGKTEAEINAEWPGLLSDAGAPTPPGLGALPPGEPLGASNQAPAPKPAKPQPLPPPPSLGEGGGMPKPSKPEAPNMQPLAKPGVMPNKVQDQEFEAGVPTRPI